ncbi:MAG TPA: 2'-deoxycytidine 5'-triphosphate deaminase, partial [Candidatus Binatia bacterium]|nr:2'-deoxycytidine 5'-triphosphate deaminase [Candidatus Binatia bacterium]
VSYRGEHGEYKSHKAGFIDPGFGYGENGEAEAASVVCEITNVAGVRIMLKDGQPIATCVYEYMREVPMAAYGATTGVGKLSNYQGQQGVKLAKFFRPWNEKSQLVTS